MCDNFWYPGDHWIFHSMQIKCLLLRCLWNGLLFIFLHLCYVHPVHQIRWVRLVNTLAFSPRVAEAVPWVCPSLTRIFILSPLSRVFTICSRKPAGKGYHCHCEKNWGIKKGKKRKLKASLLFLICGQSLCYGKQALCLVKCESGSELSLLLQLQMLFALGFTPQPGCDCVCAEPTHRNFLVQFKTESYIYLRLAFFFFFSMKSAVRYI